MKSHPALVCSSMVSSSAEHDDVADDSADCAADVMCFFVGDNGKNVNFVGFRLPGTENEGKDGEFV